MVMSTLLQLDSAAWDRKLNFTQYASAAAELLHASRDAIQALTTFAELALDSTGSSSMLNASWLDFDAHPGDCACQIRPAAMHLIVRSFRSDSLKTQALLHDTLARLHRVEEIAKQTFYQLCTLNLSVSKIGAGLERKSMPLKEFCYAIGAQDWFDLMRERQNWLAHSPLDSTLSGSINGSACDANLSIPAIRSKETNDSLCGIDNGHFDLSDPRSPVSFTSSETAPSTSSLMAKLSPESSNKGDESSFSTTPLSSCANSTIFNKDATFSVQPKVQFHVDDWSFVVKWIVICFSLGRYRQVLPNKKSDSLVYRISVPDVLKNFNQRDGALLQCENPKGAHRCPHSKAGASVGARITTEIERMQSWVSHASADLVVTLSKLCDPSAHQVAESFRVGPREVGCVPTFLTIQPLMFAWKQMELPLFIVLKTVTEHGYMIKYFRADWRGSTADATPSIRDLVIEAIAPQQADSDVAAQTLGSPHVAFYSQRVKLEQDGRLYSSSRCVEEMELQQDVPSSLLPTTRPPEDLDDDTEHLVQALSNGGLHDMLQGFFAQHCDFPFPNDESKQLRAWSLKQQDWVDYSIRHGCNYSNASTMVPRHCFYGTPIELMRICEASVQSGSPLSVPGFLNARTLI